MQLGVVHTSSALVDVLDTAVRKVLTWVSMSDDVDHTVLAYVAWGGSRSDAPDVGPIRCCR